MEYHLDSNNVYDTVETNLNIINRFLAYYILTSLDIKSIKIRK